ncbi:MAG: hypothetical protein GKR98_11445 [Boseongicola sp.]|nr:MAG: hypothetical protein GKR98_11445 [Boseongicola sp.]
MSRHSEASITWLNDALPHLTKTCETAGSFDFANINAVWHHLSDHDRDIGFASLAKVLRRDATLIMSLRHGPAPADRPAHPVSAERTIAQAQTHGFQNTLNKPAASSQACNQRSGVTWTWLAFTYAPEVSK